MGYLNKELSSEDKQEPLELIEDYRQELVPLIVPLTLLQHHLRWHPVPPAPAEYRSQGGGGDRREGQGEWVWDVRGGSIWRLGRRN